MSVSLPCNMFYYDNLDKGKHPANISNITLRLMDGATSIRRPLFLSQTPMAEIKHAVQLKLGVSPERMEGFLERVRGELFTSLSDHDGMRRRARASCAAPMEILSS